MKIQTFKNIIDTISLFIIFLVIAFVGGYETGNTNNIYIIYFVFLPVLIFLTMLQNKIDKRMVKR